MAKWGEGDPRWIVEERADAKNVNNWHWTEKNATQWSTDKIRNLLAGFVIDSNDYFIELTNVTKCEGEAIANNRKAKLIFFYEWAIEVEWDGHKKNSENKTKFHGKIEINNLSEEYTVEELDITINCDSCSADARDIKDFLKVDGSKKIRNQLGTYISELKQEYGKDLLLPTKEAPAKTSQINANAAAIKSSNASLNMASNSRKSDSSAVSTISLTEDFLCTPADLFRVFTTEDLTKSFTRSDAIVQPVEGGDYSVFGGNVTGKFIEFVSEKLISLTWRKQNWPSDHYSFLKIELAPCEAGTRLTLTQSNVPGSDAESTKNGWSSHYFNAIRQTFGFGGRIM